MTKLNNCLDVPSGFMIINKPSGPTSHNIIDQLRQITGIKKIGHAGTLDPFATGVLLVAIGRRATREINKYVKLNKVYRADLVLGAVSSTHDPEGEINFNKHVPEPSFTKIQATINKFIGKQKQIPPMFSAKKINGKKLYQLAREGKIVERQPHLINITAIKILSFKWPKATLIIHCSSGTYIRSLARDIGRELKTGAYLANLQRIAIDKFLIKDAVLIDDLNKENWQKKLFLSL